MTDLYYKRPGDPGQVITTDRFFDLHTLHALVEGYIEVAPYINGIYMICNEEAHLLDLDYNFFGIYGPILFVRINGENFQGLTRADIDMLRKTFKED